MLSGSRSGRVRSGVMVELDPGGDPGVDLVAGGESTPVVVLGCEGGPQGFGHGGIRLFRVGCGGGV